MTSSTRAGARTASRGWPRLSSPARTTYCWRCATSSMIRRSSASTPARTSSRVLAWAGSGVTRPIVPKPSPEVARLRRGPHDQLLALVGDEVEDAVGGVLQDPAYDECCRRARDAPVAGPRARRDHDVEQAGLVLEVEEGDAAGGAGALAVGDQSGDLDPPPGLHACHVADRHHA